IGRRARPAGRPLGPPLAARDVHVARAQRAALGREAGAVQAHEGQRDAALALAGRVATPHVGELLEVQGGDERVAEAPDGLPALAGDRGLDRDAVVAADRLAQDPVVSDGLLALEQRAALRPRDGALQLAAAIAGLRVASDRRL